MTFHRLELANGLTVIGEQNPAARSLAAGYFVRTGARDETREINGVSHFLEHMMFKGTARRSAEDINREFDEIGANYNAFTSEENTVYFGAVLPEHQWRVIDLLTDMMRPALRPEDFEMEKQVILEEIAMYEDRPQFWVSDLARSTFYGEHPLGYPVLGTIESIRQLTREQMRAYWQARYASNNLFLALTGNYDWESAVRQVSELTVDWRPAAAPRELAAPPGRKVVRAVARPNLQQEHLCFVFPGFSAQSDAMFAAEVIATAIGAPVGSRLYWRLIEPGLATTAQMSHSEEDGTGQFYLYTACPPERTATIVAIVREVLAEAMAQGLPPDEIERAKRKVASELVLQGETPFGRLLHVGFDWQYRRQLRPLSEVVDRFLAVTAEEVAAVLARRPFETETVVALGPVEAIG